MVVLKILVLISGGGSNLEALCEACEQENYPARIVAVGADVHAPGLTHATERNIPTFVVSPSRFSSRDAWGDALLEHIRMYQPDLVVSAGFMRIIPPHVVEQLSPHLINTHPSLLPAFPGAHAVRDALAAKVAQSGVTVHVIDAGVDTGPVLRQQAVLVRPGDTEATLHERIKAVERPLLTSTVQAIALGTLTLPTQHS